MIAYSHIAPMAGILAYKNFKTWKGVIN